MKIAMLCSTHPVNDARVTHKQAVSLAKAGHEIVVFGQESKKSDDIPSVILKPLGPADDRFKKRFAMMFKLYRAAASWRPDVVVCHEPESALIGLLLKLRYGMKVVYDVHECVQETVTRRMPKILRPVVCAGIVSLLKVIVRGADWVTVVSPPNYKFLGKMRGYDRIDILHNSPIIELFPLCSQDVDGPVTVIHEGFLGIDRGLVQMLKAIAIASRSRDIRFSVLGQLRPQDQKIFGDKINQLGLGRIVTVTGWKPWREIGQIESQAQIGLICLQNTPNNFMSLSNKLYNYMSCGHAIIGPEGSATADMINKYECGLCVDTSQPEEIAEAILKLCNNPELRKQMGANGRKAIEQELGWHKMEEVLAGIYEKLASELKT